MLKRSEPHPWLVPLYRRVLVLAVCCGWLAFETLQHEQNAFWLLIASLTTGYAVWEFFLGPNYRKRDGDG